MTVPAQTPNIGLNFGWETGDDDWGGPVNWNWLLLDVVSVPFAKSITLTVPPTSPEDGDRYIIPAGATGVWANKVGRIAYFASGQWLYFQPKKGWYQRVFDTHKTYVWNGTEWEYYLDSITPEMMAQINAAVAAGEDAVAAAANTAADRAAVHEDRLAVDAARQAVDTAAAQVSSDKTATVSAKNTAVAAANDAAASKQSASESAVITVQKAQEAAASAGSASTSASNAATSAGQAVTARDAAVGAKVDLFNRYYGPLSSDPATRPDGNPVQAGDEYTNTTTGKRRYYNGAEWDNLTGVATADLAAVDGAALVGVATYAQLRAYTGDATRIQIGGRQNYFDGGHGIAVRTGSAADNDGTVWKDGLGRSWVRQYSGEPDVRWFGVKGDGVTDDTAAIQQWASSISRGVFPAGTFVLSGTITMSPNGFYMRCAGRTKTIFKMTTDATAFKSANSGTGRSFDGYMEGFAVHGFSGSTERILDFRGASYYRFRDVQVIGDLTGTTPSGSIGLDLTRGAASFNGYVSLDGFYCTYCQTGYIAEVNQLTVTGGVCNNNSVRGAIIQRSADISVLNAEYSGNGEGTVATYVGAFPNGKYDKGGLLIDDTVGVTVNGTWGERNANRGTLAQYSKNDIEVTSTCRRVSVKQGRPDNAPYGRNHGQSMDYGVSSGDELANGLQGTYGLVANGQLLKVDATGKPVGWNAVGAISYSAASTLPSGIAGIRLTASSGVPKFYQQVLSAAQCAAITPGTKISATFWVNAVTSPWSTGYCRAGFTTTANGASAGSAYISASASPNYVQRVTVEYTIAGTEVNGLSFFIEFYQTSGTWAVEIGNVCANIGTVVFRNFDRPITSDGGELGGMTITYGAAVPTTGAGKIGDIHINTIPTELGTTGSKYVIDRWRCVSAGTPGTWVQCRYLTGG